MACCPKGVFAPLIIDCAGGIRSLQSSETLRVSIILAGEVVTNCIISELSTNDDITIAPDGTGALRASKTGNARGNNAVDFQMVKAADTMVASGNFSVIAGGEDNTVAGVHSTVSGGDTNNIDASSSFSTISGGTLNDINNSDNATIGGGTNNNILATTTTSDYSTIGGGQLNDIDNSIQCCIAGGTGGDIDTSQQGVIAGGSAGTILNARRSAIIGGLTNTITSPSANGSQSGTIVGGQSNTITTSTQATIVGGNTNTIQTGANSAILAGGTTNTITQAPDSAIFGGENNDINAGGDFSMIACGSDNIISGNYALLSGRENLLNQDYGLCYGYQAVAEHIGVMAHASGRIASDGDAQGMVMTLRRQTTDATANVDLFLDGSATGMLVPPNGAWAFQALVVGQNDDGSQAAGYILIGCVRRDSTGAATAVGTLPTQTIIGEDNAAWDATAAVVSNDLRIRVTGVAATTINWFARVTLSQLIGAS